MRFHQSERMSNSDYLEKPQDLVEVYEHLGGEPWTSKARVDSLLIDPDLADDDERQEAKIKVRDEYIAVLLLTKSNPKRYGSDRWSLTWKTHTPEDRMDIQTW